MDYIWQIILGAALVTYIPRMIPLVLGSKKELPDIVLQWLTFVPPAVLAALLAPSLLLNGNSFDFSLNNTYLLAAVPTFFVAIIWRSMVFTVIAGMLSIVLLGFL